MRFRNLLNKIYPEAPVGGLEVGDSIIRLTEFIKGRPTTEAYRLPPGVVVGGQVKNKAGFVAVLKELARKSPNKGKLAIVLTIPSSNVFIQTVKLPPAASRNLEEAAALNVQMVSPLRQGEFYYDWQKVSKDKVEGGPIELLAAFVPKQTVDDFAACLGEAGLRLIAVEFTSLSLGRELTRQRVVETGKAYLTAEILPEGTTFALMQSSGLLFHSFHKFGSEGGQVAVKDFVTALTKETQDIANFYLAHWGSAVNDYIFITAGLTEEIKNAFKDKSITVLDPETVSPATGAAIRRVLGEKEINLLGTSSLTVYEESRALTFVSLWRTVLVSTLGFLLLAALGADVFLRQLAKREMEVNALTLNEPGHRELMALREEAAKFNGLVALIKEARGTINDLAGVEVRISRFYLPSPEESVTATGIAENEQAAIQFKNRLAADKNFAAVDLPISDILPEAGGKVRFTIHLKLNL